MLCPMLACSQVEKAILGGRGNPDVFSLVTSSRPWSWHTGAPSLGLARKWHGCLQFQGDLLLVGGADWAGAKQRGIDAVKEDLGSSTKQFRDLPDMNVREALKKNNVQVRKSAQPA